MEERYYASKFPVSRNDTCRVRFLLLPLDSDIAENGTKVQATINVGMVQHDADELDPPLDEYCTELLQDYHPDQMVMVISVDINT